MRRALLAALMAAAMLVGTVPGGRGGAQTTQDQPTKPSILSVIKPVALATSLTSLMSVCNKLGESQDPAAADELKTLIRTEVTPEQQEVLKKLASIARAYTGPFAGVVKVPKSELDKVGITDDELKVILRNFAAEYGKFSTKFLPPPPPVPAKT
jgi:hypothetical protein